VQHLRQLGTHARTLPGGKDDDLSRHADDVSTRS